MNNIFQLLEKIGNDATLVDENKLSETVLIADISDEIKELIFNKDIESLEAQLNVRNKIFCGVHTPDEDEDEGEDEDSTEENSTSVANF